MVRRIIALVLILILVACGTPPQAGPVAQLPVAGTPTLIPTLGVDAYNAQIATANALGVQAQQTRDSIIAQDTRVASETTATAAAVATATQSVINTAVAETAAAETATAQSVAIRQTDTALNLLVANATTGAGITATWVAYQVEVEKTASAQLAQQNQNAIDAAAEQQRIDNQIRQAEAERQANWASFTRVAPYLVTLIIVVVGLVAAAFFFYRERSRTPQIFNGNVLMIPDVQGQGQPMIYDIGPPRIPLLEETNATRRSGMAKAEAEVEGEIEAEAEDIPPADWSKFTAWRDDLHLPIGITLRRRPILINRNTEPHLLIFGGSGSGKTTSGLIPYISAMVGAGVHAVIVNARGADFKPFENHPGVTMAPGVERDMRPQMMASLLTAMVDEIDRRDKVLHRYGVSSWYQLPTHAGESGEFLVAVDEFLDIIVTSRRVDPSLAGLFWAKLINLTSEGRKYGAFVALTMTEPTARALGDDGMQVRGQMARMGFNMRNAAASRSILDNPRGFTNGSAGLPLGQFIASVNGTTQQAVAFHPTPQQVQMFLNERRSRTTELPQSIMELASGRESWTEEAEGINQIFLGNQPALNDPASPLRYLSHEKAEMILNYAPTASSLNDIARRFFNYDGGNASVVVKGVLVAQAITLYQRGTEPEQIEQALFGGRKSFSPDLIREAITQYQKLPLAG